MSARATRLLLVGMTVSDFDGAIAFYRDALGFAFAGEAESDPALADLFGVGSAHIRRAVLSLGAQSIELATFDPPGRPYPPGSTATDLWFQHIAIVVADMSTAFDRLRRYPMTPITEDGPQLLPPEAGGVTAYKFRDPDGHPLELLHFPPGSGDARWHHKPPGAVALGIDHSAISVADAAASAAFYSGCLGLTQAAHQVNRGPAQERLDHAASVVVDVVAMQPASESTPHVELLGYHTPRGRPAPDQRMNDIAATRLVFQAEHLQALAAPLAASQARLISPAPATLRDGALAIAAHDPDGHAMVLVQAAPDS